MNWPEPGSVNWPEPDPRCATCNHLHSSHWDAKCVVTLPSGRDSALPALACPCNGFVLRGGFLSRPLTPGDEIIRDDPRDGDINVVLKALGELDTDHGRIAAEGIQWIAQMIRKNRDYGSSVWERPALAPDCPSRTGILIRMGDKWSRLCTLLSGKVREVKDESIEDTMRDLGAYALLWLACPEDRR